MSSNSISCTDGNGRQPAVPSTDHRQAAERVAAQIVELLPIFELEVDDPTRITREEPHIAMLVENFAQREKSHPNEHPVQTPLRVVKRQTKYLIIAGVYRYFAALRRGLKTLPCIIMRHELDAAQTLIEQFTDNALHKPYTPLEQAQNIVKLRQLRPHLSQGHAAALLGIHACDATRAMKVINHYPADLHALIGEGDGFVPITAAYQFARLMEKTNDEAKVRELTDRVVKGQLSRDDAVAVVKKLLGHGQKKVDTVKVKHGGVVATVTGKVLDELEAFIAKATEVVKKIRRGDYGPDGAALIGSLLK